jgi:hypothetical protein
LVLLTPTSDNRMSTSTVADPVPGATTVIEADTAEEALSLVQERLGTSARIIEARRVRRGGIGGFFAREVVQMHAAPGDEPDAPGRVPSAEADRDSGAEQLPEPVSESVPDRPSEDTAPIDRLLARAEGTSDVVDFATFLREQLGRDEPAPSQAVVQPVTWPTVVAEERDDEVATPGSKGREESSGTCPADEEDGPMWSVRTLIRLGLPSGLVRTMEIDEDADDLAWTTALAAALRPLCRPLPTGRSLLVGPCARGLARQLGTPVARIGEPLRRTGDVAAALAGGAAGLDWLHRARRGRWLHLVAGGKGWRPLLHEDPLAISWATAEDLPEVIRLASELGLVLGHGPLHDGIGRARPLEVALAVRALVPRS